jgi:hypothetical protein
MLKALEIDCLTEEEKDKLRFLSTYKNFIFQTHQMLSVLYEIQTIMKNKGFNTENVNHSLKLLDTLNDNNTVKIKKMIVEYFNNTLSKMSKMKNTDTIYCSSDIVESCFGKYKELVKANKTVGITDLSLCIAALTGDNSEDDIMSCFEKKTVKDIKEWKKENIEETLFMQKRTLFKKLG